MTWTLRNLTSARPRAVRSVTVLVSAALLVSCSSVGVHGEGAPAEDPRPTIEVSSLPSGTVGAAVPSPSPPPPFSNGTSTFPAFRNGTPEFVESFPDPAPASPDENSPVEDVEVASTAIERCTASWYGEDHRGLLTASGQPFDPDALTAAMWDVPFGTQVIVSTGSASVTVEVTDRGPARRLNRCIDLSAAAFDRLAPLGAGLVEVTVQVRR